MNAIAKASTVVLVAAALAPALLVTLSGCDKFKKSGDGDAAADAAAPTTTTTAADTSTASASATTTATTLAPNNWKPAAPHDAGVIKLPDGGLAMPSAIPTPIPSGAAPPGTLTIPTALPSGMPSVIPTTFPSGLKIPSAIPKLQQPPTTH